MGNKITIEPVSRVEATRKVTVYLNDAGQVDKTYLHITQVRGFEKFCEGRLFNEMGIITPRICGICRSATIWQAAKAGRRNSGSGTHTDRGDAAAVTALLRKCCNPHALHFFYLASPDLLFGMESDPATRNIIGVIGADPELAKKRCFSCVRSDKNNRIPRREKGPPECRGFRAG